MILCWINKQAFWVPFEPYTIDIVVIYLKPTPFEDVHASI